MTKHSRYRIQSLRGGLIRSYGGWNDFEIQGPLAKHLEKRDAGAIKAAANSAPPSPCDVRYEAESVPRGFEVYARVRTKTGDIRGGEIDAYRESGGPNYVVNSAKVPTKLLATCPGLGTGLYDRAAREACKRGGVLAGSADRSAFSEAFWMKQVRKKRATCGEGAGKVYEEPHRAIFNALENGTISVPEYNRLISRLPKRPPTPPRPPRWPCRMIPLLPCGGTREAPLLPVDDSLRGLRKRKRR